MGHGINDIIHAKPVGQSRHGLRVEGIIGMLPGVAHIHIEIDRDHQTPIVIENTPPGLGSLQPGLNAAITGAIEMSLSGYLRQLIQLIEHIEHFIFTA